MATDVKKHTTFAAGEVPKRQVSGGAGLADVILSINDVVPVGNATEQAQIGAGLAGTAYPVSSTRPLVTVRSDARPLHQVEVSRDGAVFVPASGVLSFPTTSLRDTWTSANSGLLSVGDLCNVGALQTRWDGAAWQPPAKHLANPGAAIAAVAIPQTAMDATPVIRTGMVTANPIASFGNGYMPGVTTLAFPTAVLTLQLTEIVADGATKSAGGIAFDVFDKNQFRAFYPGDTSTSKRAFTYLAIGY